MNDFIKNFWESQAIKHQKSQAVSWEDDFAIDLEIDAIGKHIRTGDIVLDVGCANGFASFRQLENNKIAKIYGIDFAENMIKYANQVREKYPEKDRIKFRKGDIREIDFEDNIFDLVYTTRVIINLPNWEDQKKAINECLRVTKKGGKVVFSEAFYEPLILLNAMRTLNRLPPLYEHDFNRYIKKERLENHLREMGYTYKCDEFSSIYYLGSRFLRELVSDIENYMDYSNPINKMFYDIEKKISIGGFGIQQAYIVEKN